MSFQQIRALVETRTINAFSALTPPVPVVFDNVGGEPPATEYVELSISYVNFYLPVLRLETNGIEAIRGNIQLSIYSPKGNGMRRIEELDFTGMALLDQMKTNEFSVGEVLGPVQVLSGDDPLALSNISAPFNVRISGGSAVSSVYGRTGNVNSQEGDYSIDQMADVSSATPAPGEVMEWDGTQWIPAASVDSEDF
jgi:hypothetical protein